MPIALAFSIVIFEYNLFFVSSRVNPRFSIPPASHAMRPKKVLIN
jgi:hypothetical protein